MYKITEYKGNKIIVLSKDEDDKFPFSFGLSKAKLIVENIDSIKQFINDNKKER